MFARERTLRPASARMRIDGTEAPDMNRTETLSDRLSKHRLPTPGRDGKRAVEELR